MAGTCKWILRIGWGLYLFALAMLLTGTFGLFGQPRDPVSGAFLAPLGLPWALWTDGLPEAGKPWLAILAPMVNLLLLTALCRLLPGRTPNR